MCVAMPRSFSTLVQVGRWRTVVRATRGSSIGALLDQGPVKDGRFGAFGCQEEWEGVRRTRYFMKYESAYQKIQGTKPQTLGEARPQSRDQCFSPGYGLTDSPVGLLAWILEPLEVGTARNRMS